MYYLLCPWISLILITIFIPLSLKNKKFFFKKSFFLGTKSPFNFNAFFYKLSQLVLMYFILFLFTTHFWGLVFQNNLFIYIGILFSGLLCFSSVYTNYVWPWECTLILLNCLFCGNLLFLKANFFIYFFILESLSNLIFYLIFYKSFQDSPCSTFNVIYKFNQLYSQLLINSLASVLLVFFLIVCQLPIQTELSTNHYLLLILILMLKVGVGPSFLLKWYIFKALTFFESFFLSVLYLFIFIFMYLYILYYVQSFTLTPYYVIMAILINNFFLLILFFEKVKYINHFLQYSSLITYNVFFIILL